MTADAELVEIRYLEMPLSLRELSNRHGAELLREMTLIVGGRDSGTTSRAVPERLLQIATELDSVYGPFVSGTDELVESATDLGEETLPEVVYRVPPSIAGFVQHISDVLDEVEDYCRQGKDLLTLTSPADVVAYRTWALEEVVRQVAGEQPTPWPAFAARNAG